MPQDTLSGLTSYLVATVTAVVGMSANEWLIILAILTAVVRLFIDVPRALEAWDLRKRKKDVCNRE